MLVIISLRKVRRLFQECCCSYLALGGDGFELDFLRHILLAHTSTDKFAFVPLLVIAV